MTSPCWRPAFSAGVPGTTAATAAPAVASSAASSTPRKPGVPMGVVSVGAPFAISAATATPRVVGGGRMAGGQPDTEEAGRAEGDRVGGAALCDPGSDAPRRVDRDGEGLGSPLARREPPASRARGVHADDLAGAVVQRAARITGL